MDRSKNRATMEVQPTPATETEVQMTRLKQLLHRLDAYTLETFNPPLVRRRTTR